MSGIAQRLFAERYDTAIGSRTSLPASNDVLRRLIQAGYPLTLEQALAKQLLGATSSVPAAIAFVTYLCLAVRQGHLCVLHSPDGLKPDPVLVLAYSLPDKKGILTDQSLVRQFESLIREGATLLPSLIDFDDARNSLVSCDGRYYLRRFWNYESIIVRNIQRLLKQPPRLAVPATWAEHQLQLLQQAGVLKEAQAKAIRLSCGQCLTFVAGGPGTGKTYTAAQTIALIVRATHEAGRQLNIALAAPTGKAAANLSATLGRSLEDFNVIVRAQTLHALLGIGKRSDDDEWEAATLGADLIVVDEGSMVDAYLMARLLNATKEGARLIILGDPEQLPSVQAGGVFSDMVASFASCSGPVVYLQECVRTDAPLVLKMAAAVQNGDIGCLQSMVRTWDSGDDHRVWRAIVDHCTPLLTLSARLPNDTLCRSANEVRLLTPLRDGPWGVDQLNRKLLELAWQAQDTAPRAVPIIITTNDYRLGLFNGDVGILICHGREVSEFRSSEADYALFSTATGEVQRIDAIRLPKYEYAYCLSVHRSQGSEYDRVLLLLPPRSEVFGREIVYTGVTRARHAVDIWSSRQVLEIMLARRMQRYSGLRERLGAIPKDGCESFNGS